MKSNRTFRIIVFLVLVLINFGCDQISKSIVRKEVKANTTIQLIDGNFILTKVENTGAFLGMGSDFSPFLRDILFLWLPALLILGALIWILNKKDVEWILIFAFSFIIGGGIGNILDRIVYGSVTDFLHINLGIIKTGIFNLADVSVMVGMGILLIENFRAKNKVEKSA